MIEITGPCEASHVSAKPRLIREGPARASATIGKRNSILCSRAKPCCITPDAAIQCGQTISLILRLGLKHSIENDSDQASQVVIMGFKIPAWISITAPASEPKIVNMDELKQQTVEGHPTSVLYKLLAGPRSGTRDAIDQAYVVVSLFWMNFAPGGTNFPHHHEMAEEIYLVVDGEGDMVAGGGMDGIEGRYPAKAGDAYYFRANSTVGFYNQNKPGAKAHILAVRSLIPRPKEED